MGCIIGRLPVSPQKPSLLVPPPPRSSLIIVTFYSHKTKMSKTWSKDCEGRQYLLKEFKKFAESGGTEGIDFEAALKLKLKRVKEEIFDVSSILRDYKRERFPENFRDTILAFKIDLKKTQARKKGEFFFTLLLFY